MKEYRLLNSAGASVGNVTLKNLEEYMNRFSWI